MPVDSDRPTPPGRALLGAVLAVALIAFGFASPARAKSALTPIRPLPRYPHKRGTRFRSSIRSQRFPPMSGASTLAIWLTPKRLISMTRAGRS